MIKIRFDISFLNLEIRTLKFEVCERGVCLMVEVRIVWNKRQL